MEAILKNIKQNGIANLEVFEDNGGGLTLAVWCDDEFFCSSGFEYQVGSLVGILQDLQHETPHNLENMKEMTESEYYYSSCFPNYGHIILNLEDGFVSVDRIGAAGRKEFAEFIGEDE